MSGINVGWRSAFRRLSLTSTGEVKSGLSEVEGAPSSGTIPDDWTRHAAKVAPVFIAIPMGIFGVQHFIYLDFVAHFIPEWIPWRTFWACFTGVALIAAAAGIIFKLWNRWAATLLGTMIFLWVVLLHTSRIAAQPNAFGEWRGIFQALAMSGCAFALAATLGSARSLKVAPYFVGVAISALGIEHFIFAQVATPQVPVWIPGPDFVNYLVGILLIGCGVGICIPRARRNSALALAVAVFSSMLFFHLPFALHSSRFESDWTKTFVISGGAILLARVARNSASPQTSIARRDIIRDLPPLKA